LSFFIVALNGKAQQAIKACDSIKICGVLQDSVTKEAIPFANVVVERYGMLIAGATTDIDGQFSLKAPYPYNDRELKLKCASEGYKIWTYPLIPGQIKDRLGIKMVKSSTPGIITIDWGPPFPIPGTATYYKDDIKHLAR
jgi:hypothetical protein